MISTEELLRLLVSIDSRNPALVPGAPGEAQLATTLADWLVEAGLEVELIDTDSGRPTVIGWLRGTGGGKTLLLNSHTDTVGFGDMHEPLTPRVEQGRLYGRGSYDMKGGLVAILQATAALARGPRLAGDLVLTLVSDEEHASRGTEAAIAHLQAKGARVDAAIITEPTDLQLCLAHKGFFWATITTQGVAAHGSRRADGVDAIAHMGRVLVALEQLDEELQTRPAHPLLGHGSLHASLISGGTGLSTYPPHCTLQIERRTLPNENAESVLRELNAILDRLHAADPRFQGQVTLDMFRPSLGTPADTPIAQALHTAATDVLGAPPPHIGATFWMDSALLDEAGIPTVIFGPRGAGLHADVEWVDLASVDTCATVLEQTARAFCQNAITR